MKNQYKKDFTEELIEKNIWLQDWNTEDYKTYEHELLKIHEEYQECEKIYFEKRLILKDKKKRTLFTTDWYQIRNGGMTEDFRIKYKKGLSDQVYDVNSGKIDKYFKWLKFSEPFEYNQNKEDILKKRFDTIKALTRDINMTTLTTSK